MTPSSTLSRGVRRTMPSFLLKTVSNVLYYIYIYNIAIVILIKDSSIVVLFGQWDRLNRGCGVGQKLGAMQSMRPFKSWA